MDIDSETLEVPDTDFSCAISMPSNEFQRICRDLGAIGDTVSMSASKDGLKFSVEGEIGKGSITCRQSSAVDESKVKHCCYNHHQMDFPLFVIFRVMFLPPSNAMSPLNCSLPCVI